ncbi:MAG: recombination regulator RecX [Xanthomonadales bacterium]|nr:recombination regulator RecX [Xanthomonadales bacterium]
MKSTPNAETKHADAKAVVVRLLARREYSQYELIQRLRQRGFSDAESQTVVAEAAAADWQSDERFTLAFVRSRIERLQGPLKIRAELRSRGVEGHALSLALDELAPDWEAMAFAYIERHERFHEAPIKARQALQRRGFQGDHAQRAWRAWEAQQRERQAEE